MAWTIRSDECLAHADIDAYVRGTAEPAERQRVLAHVAECMRCSTMIRAAQASAWDANDYGPSTGSSAAGLPTPPSLAPAFDTMTYRDGQTTRPSSVVEWLRPGDEVQGYRLHAHLGQGSMGVTWRAQREYEAEPVALKILPDHLRAHQDEMDRVKHVFNLIKSLRHPAIAMVYQLCESILGTGRFSLWSSSTA